MCEDCFTKGINRFETWQGFESFERVLRQKSRQYLHETECTVPFPATMPPPETCYRCATCQEVWALSYPENSWRGYFLPEAAALDYGRKRHRNGRIRTILSLLLLVAAGLFLAWKWR